MSGLTAISITNEDNPIRVAAGRLYAQNLAEVGIKVDFRPLPFARLVERLNLEEKRPDYQAMIVSFGIEDSVLDPGYLFCLFHSRGGCHIYRFSDAQGEDLSEAQRRIDSILEDPGATPEVLVELQRLLTEDLPLIPLWSKRVVTAHRGEVQNVQKINVFGHLTFLEVLWRE
jgi:ABC-type transport system substrate-binding protein